MVELYLFIIVGAVAVAAATMMLLSENAVHSALFLIVNFACVAFLYLMLEAPFLAMVQVAVYAGAIMVLFLFVIMLLGAEQSESRPVQMRSLAGYRYHTPVALLLSLVLLVTVGIAINQGGIGSLSASTQPMVRVLHFGPAAGHYNVALDGEMIAEDITYRSSTDIVPVEAGDHELVVTDVETGEVVYEGSVAVETPESDGQVVSVVMYGLEEITTASFVEDMSAPPERQARMFVFNAFEGPVSLQDTGVFGRDGDATVLISGLEPGTVSEPLYLNEGTYETLRFVRPDDEADDRLSVSALFTVRERELERETSNVAVVKSIPNSTVPDVGFIQTSTQLQFGSPKAVGQILFTTYLLPLQVVALLLLAALVGVIVIAQRQVSPAAVSQSAARRPVRRRVSRPLTSVIANQVSSDVSDAPSLTAGEEPAGD